MSGSTITFNTKERILICMFQTIGKRVLIIDRGFSKTAICINVFINHNRDACKIIMKVSSISCWFAVFLPSLFTDCIPWFLWSLPLSLFINFQEVLIALLHYTTVLQRYISLWLRYSLPYYSCTELCSHYIQLCCYYLSRIQITVNLRLSVSLLQTHVLLLRSSVKLLPQLLHITVLLLYATMFLSYIIVPLLHIILPQLLHITLLLLLINETL